MNPVTTTDEQTVEGTAYAVPNDAREVVSVVGGNWKNVPEEDKATTVVVTDYTPHMNKMLDKADETFHMGGYESIRGALADWNKLSPQMQDITATSLEQAFDELDIATQLDDGGPAITFDSILPNAISFTNSARFMDSLGGDEPETAQDAPEMNEPASRTQTPAAVSTPAPR